MISKDGDSMVTANKYLKFLIIWNFAFISRLDPSWFNFQTTDVFYIIFIYFYFYFFKTEEPITSQPSCEINIGEGKQLA